VLEPVVATREPAAPKSPELVVLACAATGAIGLRPGQLDTSFHGVDDLLAARKTMC